MAKTGCAPGIRPGNFRRRRPAGENKSCDRLNAEEIRATLNTQVRYKLFPSDLSKRLFRGHRSFPGRQNGKGTPRTRHPFDSLRTCGDRLITGAGDRDAAASGNCPGRRIGAFLLAVPAPGSADPGIAPGSRTLTLLAHRQLARGQILEAEQRQFEAVLDADLLEQTRDR